MNKFFTQKKDKIDLPLYRAYVVNSIGCIVDDQNCNGSVQPNHFILAAQGGSDIECGGLCDHHHREFHKSPKEFLVRYNIKWDQYRTRLLESFFVLLDAGARVGVTAKPKSRSRGRNLQPLTKKVGGDL